MFVWGNTRPRDNGFYDGLPVRTFAYAVGGKRLLRLLEGESMSNKRLEVDFSRSYESDSKFVITGLCRMSISDWMRARARTP